MTRTALYRHYDAQGRLLYVGISDVLPERDRQHSATAHWFNDVHKTETQWCLSREHAADLERVAIKHEKPAHNKMHAAEAEPIRAVKVVEKGIAAGPALRAFLKQNRIRQGDFARRIGVGQSCVCKYITNKVTPSIDAAIAIERETLGSVPVSIWTSGRV